MTDKALPKRKRATWPYDWTKLVDQSPIAQGCIPFSPNEKRAAGMPEHIVAHWSAYENSEDGHFDYKPMSWLEQYQETLIEQGDVSQEAIQEWRHENMLSCLSRFPQVLPPEFIKEYGRPATSVPDNLPPPLDFLQGEVRTNIQLEDGEDKDASFIQVDNNKIAEPLQARINSCDTTWYKCDWRNGMLKPFRFKCDQFLHCPRCAQERADKEQNRVLSCTGNADLYRIKMPVGADSGKVTKGLDSSRYRRYPQKDGSTVILTLDGDASPDAEKIDPHALNWTQLTQTPKGSRYSGKMYEQKETAPAKEIDPSVQTKRIEIITYRFDTQGKKQNDVTRDIQNAWDFATLATCAFVVDFECIEEAIAERMRHFRAIVEERGYRCIGARFDHEFVNSDEINWEANNLYIRDKLRKKGYTNAALEVTEQQETEALEKIFAEVPALG
jgi:hypothetical protein